MHLSGASRPSNAFVSRTAPIPRAQQATRHRRILVIEERAVACIRDCVTRGGPLTSESRCECAIAVMIQQRGSGQPVVARAFDISLSPFRTSIPQYPSDTRPRPYLLIPLSCVPGSGTTRTEGQVSIRSLATSYPARQWLAAISSRRRLSSFPIESIPRGPSAMPLPHFHPIILPTSAPE